MLSLLQACLEEEGCVIIHVYLQDIIQMKRVGKIQGWSRLSTESDSSWSTHKAHIPRGTKCSHGMVSIVHYALCTNPWSTWEFFMGLGMFPWSCVKRKIPYNPWRMTSSGDRHQVCSVQVQVEQHEEWLTHNGVWGSNQVWILPSIVVSMDLLRCAEESLTHSGLSGSNHLVFIEPTQSIKVVQLEGVKIVFI